MRLRVAVAACLVAGLCLAPLLAPPARALDHKNLDVGRPLALEDPYAIAYREWNAELGAGFTHERLGPDRGFWTASFLYGAAPNTQVAVETMFSSDPRRIGGPSKSGDVAFSCLYNFSNETLGTPALGIAGRLELPTGLSSSGIDGSVKGLATKSIGRAGLHANLELGWTGAPRGGERWFAHRIVGGVTCPWGAPRNTRLLLLSDIVVAGSTERGEPDVVGAEAGFRYQWQPRTILDGGLGADLFGAGDRAPFHVTVGVSRAW